jgi:hypothetical protein
MGVVSVFCSSLNPQSMETKLGRKVYDLKVDRKYTKKQEAQRYIKKRVSSVLILLSKNPGTIGTKFDMNVH